MTPYLTTSARPLRYSRSGRVVSQPVSIQTPAGWWKAPIRFLPRGWLTPTLPPTELSTIASRLVGTINRGRPRFQVAATKPARAPTTPPPRATTSGPPPVPPPPGERVG